jgi:hypothetical protein
MQLLVDAKAGLFPKRDHIIKQMARLGLTAKQLTTKELIELFYDIYNPAPTGTQRIILDTASYTVPIVEPAVEIPAPAPVGSVIDTEQFPARSEVLSEPDDSLSQGLQVGGQVPPQSPAPVIPQPISPAVQELRPVPPAPSQQQETAPLPVSGQSQEVSPQTQSAGLSPQQQTVLTSLQSVTAKAAQLVNQSQSTTARRPDGNY